MKKTEQICDATNALNDELLKHNLQATKEYRQKERQDWAKIKKIAYVAAGTLAALVVGTELADKANPDIMDNDKVTSVFAGGMLVSLAVAAIAGILASVGGDDDMDSRYFKELLLPLYRSMEGNVFREYPEASTKAKDWGLIDKAFEEYIKYTKQYLTTHPADAKKIISILEDVGLPQELIDKYIDEYVPDTMSFAMANQMKGKESR